MLLLVALLFAACATTNSTKITEPVIDIQNESPIILSGKWTMTGVSVFTSPDRIPEYKSGDVVWDFGDGTSRSVTITKQNVDERDFSMGAGTHNIAKNQHVISVAGRQYLYTVMGNSLILDSNINPNISNDAAVFALEKMGAPQPTEYVETPYPNLSGKWTLTQYSAYMEIDNSESYPEYNDGDVVWEFQGTSGRDLVITKKNPDDKNDFSIKQGTYEAYMNKHIIAIRVTDNFDQNLYMISLKDDKLILDSNLDPMLGPDGPVLTFKRME